METARCSMSTMPTLHIPVVISDITEPHLSTCKTHHEQSEEQGMSSNILSRSLTRPTRLHLELTEGETAPQASPAKRRHIGATEYMPLTKVGHKK